MQHMDLKQRTEVTNKKIYMLFIHKEVENCETTPDAVASLSVPCILDGNPWSIQAMSIFPQ